MSKPVCPDHGELAVFRSSSGYWFCPWCLTALFEWNRWIRKNLVPDDRKAEMRQRNYELAEEYKQRAQAQKAHEEGLCSCIEVPDNE